jgi:serine/threonine protein kinase
VKFTQNNSLKILDFGLAKALADDPSPSNISASPTLSTTRAGLILGTPAYMSPEQARGKPVDRRTDIWAFGCVLFELLTGRMAFQGETVTDTLAAVLTTHPSLEGLPPSTPPNLRRLIERCLQKDVKERLQAIGDASRLKTRCQGEACGSGRFLEFVEPNKAGEVQPGGSFPWRRSWPEPYL